MIEKPLAAIPIVPTAITSGNERAEYPADNLRLLRHIGLVWQSNGNGNLWVRGQLPAGSMVDFCTLLSANAQPGTTIRVRLGNAQAEVDGTGTAPYDSGVGPFISPATSDWRDRHHSFHRLPAPLAVTWFRIDIGGHAGDFSAANLILAQSIQPARYYDRGFEFGTEDLGAVDISSFGVPSIEDGLIWRTLSFKLGWLSADEYETQFRPMAERCGRRGLVYWCFDPQPSARRQGKTYFGWMKQNLYAQAGVKPGNYAMEFQLLSMI